MLKNDSALYSAFLAKDARFDGRFFVGISSTGIYCRPVCRARRPKLENCSFFASAAEAEQAGFRPCLLCRPELAPGTSIVDSSAVLARKAARVLEKSCGSVQSLEKLAQKLGCSDRHLRRIFAEEFNVSPVQYLQTCRLLLAKNLLTDTHLSVIDVAMAAGFGSLRRFNDLFKKHYKLSPTALRKNASKEKHSGNVTLALGYRPPYLWEEMLKFLSGRTIAGVEVVSEGKYKRTVSLTAGGKQFYGFIEVGNNAQKNTLSVSLSENLLPVLPQVLSRVRHLFDLCCDPHAVFEKLQSMNEIRDGLCVLGTRVPGCFNTFEMAVRAILGQQITVKAASTLAARLVLAYGTPVQTEIEGLTHIFPSPKDILSLQAPIEDCFGSLGIISSRSKTIFDLAQAIEQNKIDFDCNPEEVMKKLMEIRGIGSWTAQYIAMRAMEWTDAFLETDAGIKNALPDYTPKELLKLAESWRPWRSYATMNIWNSL